MNRIKLYNFLVYFLFLAFFNILFSLFYYYKIGLDFSFLSFLFLLFFVFNYIFILHFCRKIYLRTLLFAGFGIFVFYTLINFAYFDVFNAFWSFNRGQLVRLNTPMLLLLKDYYYLVPLSVYFFSFLFFLATVVSSNYYLKKNGRINPEREKIRLSFAVILLVFFVVNTSLLAVNKKYQTKISQKEFFTRFDYYSKMGLHGLLFDGFFNRAGNFLKKISAQPFAGSRDEDYVNTTQLLLEKMSGLKIQEPPPSKPAPKLDRPHILIYQLESVSSWVLKQEPSPMPFLAKLMEEKISVGRFFSNSCMTINAEFSSVCGFFPDSRGSVSDFFPNHDFYCLPSILKERHGYTSYLYHANFINFWNREKFGSAWGYDELYFTPHYPLRTGDSALLNEAVEKIKTSATPTFNYVIGFTSHSPHNQEFMDLNFYDNDIIIKNYEYEFSDNTKTIDLDEDTTKSYLGFAAAIDKIIEDLFQSLEQNDLLKNTLVIIYGDHRYYIFNSEYKKNDFYNYNEIPFVMHVPDSEGGIAKDIASQIDISPTLLHILEGDNYQKEKSFVGESLFSDRHSNSAASKCLGESFYVNSDIIIKYDSIINRTMPVAFLKEEIEPFFNIYADIFNQFVIKSDQAMTKNQLGVEK